MLVMLVFGNRVAVRNLITNAGFEAGTNGWEVSYGPTRIAVTTNDAHSGRQAGISAWRGAHYVGPEQTLLHLLRPGQTYVCSAWVRVRNGDEEPVKMTIRQRDATGKNYHHISTTTGSSNLWRFFSGRFEFQPSEPLHDLALFFEGPMRGVELLVDDVRVVPDRFLLLCWPAGGGSVVLAVGALWALATRRLRWATGCGGAGGLLALGLLASWLVDHRSVVVVGPAPDYAKAFQSLGFENVERGTLLEIRPDIQEPTLYQGIGVRIYGNCATNLAIVAKTAEIYGRVRGKVYFRGENISIMKGAEVAGGIDSSGRVIQHGAVADGGAAPEFAAAGHAAARAGDWQKAHECFQQVLAAGSTREADWSGATAAAVAAGDTNACLKLCRELLDRFGQVQDPSAAERCAKQCLVVPGLSGELLAKAVERADFSINAGPDSRWRQLAKGMAEYRTGHWSNALEWLRQPELSSDLQLCSMAWPVGAMVRYQLGDKAAAHQALDEVNLRLKVVVERGALGKAAYNVWDNYARAFALRAEAERLILGQESAVTRTNL
jgi:hypothetical protein